MKKGKPEKEAVAIARRVTAAMREREDETEEERAARVMGFLEQMCGEVRHAKGLTDEQLIEEVFDKLWGELDMDSRESALLEELITRFKGKAGVKDASDSVS